MSMCMWQIPHMSPNVFVACLNLLRLKCECTLMPSSGLPISRTSGTASNFPFRFLPGSLGPMIYSHYIKTNTLERPGHHMTHFRQQKTEIKIFDRFDNKLHRVLRSFAHMYAKFASHGLCQFKHITSYLAKDGRNIKTKSIRFETKPYHNQAALRSIHPRGMLPTLCISHTLPSDNTFLICTYLTSGTLSTNQYWQIYKPLVVQC